METLVKYKPWAAPLSVLILILAITYGYYVFIQVPKVCSKWATYMSMDSDAANTAYLPSSDDILKRIGTDTSKLNAQQKYSFWYQQCVREKR